MFSSHILPLVFSHKWDLCLLQTFMAFQRQAGPLMHTQYLTELGNVHAQTGSCTVSVSASVPYRCNLGFIVTLLYKMLFSLQVYEFSCFLYDKCCLLCFSGQYTIKEYVMFRLNLSSKLQLRELYTVTLYDLYCRVHEFDIFSLLFNELDWSQFILSGKILR